MNDDSARNHATCRAARRLHVPCPLPCPCQVNGHADLRPFLHTVYRSPRYQVYMHRVLYAYKTTKRGRAAQSQTQMPDPSAGGGRVRGTRRDTRDATPPRLRFVAVDVKYGAEAVVTWGGFLRRAGFAGR